jgi:hypothetical protein
MFRKKPEADESGPNLFAFAEGGEVSNEVKIRLSREDRSRFADLPRDASSPWIKVLDELTGTFYEVRTAPCSLACWCAAEARPVTRP